MTIEIGGLELPTISAETPPPDSAGTKAVIDEVAYLERERQRVDIHGLRQDIAERKSYANKLFVLIVGWLISILVILCLCGIKTIRGGETAFIFSLSENVLLALIGGTTVTVLGLFLVVAKYLFPSK